MLAKKVLEVLRDRLVPHDSNEECPMCLEYQWPGMAALITAAEHEAQESGGWKPGTEPPEHENEVNLAFCGCYPNEGLKMTMGYYDLEDKKWFDHWDRPFPDVAWWHALPPLPEVKP